MEEKRHNPEQIDWKLLLDKLNKGGLNYEKLTEDQIKIIKELNALIEESSDYFELYSKFDVEKGWEELRLTAQEKQLVNLERFPKKIKPLNPKKKLMKSIAFVASFFLILSFSGLLFYLNYQNENSSLKYEFQDIGPGGNKATLTLSDGRNIDLSSEYSGIVVENDVIKYSDGKIVSSDKYAGKLNENIILSTPIGGQYEITLSDGSRVKLNSASKLEYPACFTREERRVKLEGEGYFEVTSNESPFIVETHDQLVEVLGTQFNINGYKDDGTIKTTLKEGKVKVILKNNLESTILSPNQQAIGMLTGDIKVLEIDVDKELSWVNGIYVINDQKLGVIGKQLERWYNIQIDMGGFSDYKVSAVIPRNAKLSTVLEAISYKTEIQFDIKERRVIVIGD